MITDTHAHLCWESFEGDREAVLERARRAAVDRIICVGVDAQSSDACRDFCRGRAGLYWTAGLHPASSQNMEGEERERIEELCAQPDCVAIGETGLDFFKQYAPEKVQLEAFEWQLDLAQRLNKPVVIHCREAHDAACEVLAGFSTLRGVLHCYGMGPGQLSPYLEVGLCVSFSGSVTYPSNEQQRAAARELPLERLLVETDSPWLSPQAHRGQRNEPAHVRAVLACIAHERGMDPVELARTSSTAAAQLFELC